MTAVYLRIKPDGEYVVSAESPPPSAEEEWIEVAESTFVRVRPRDDGTFTVFGGTTRESQGTWVPTGDFGVVRANGLGGGPAFGGAGGDATVEAESEAG